MNSLDDTIVAISTPLGEGGIGIVRLSGNNAVSIAERLFVSLKKKTLSSAVSHSIIHGFINDPSDKAVIDEVLVSVMRSPNTYTREDIIEINCHGGIIPLQRTLELVIAHGARLAEPGEFTKRAFLNGRLDLTKAEAVLDLIKAKTDESRRIALDQLQGRLAEKITHFRDTLTEICALIEAHIDFPEDDIEVSTKSNTIDSIKQLMKELESLLRTYEEGRFFREGLAAAIVGKPNVGKSSLLNALLQKDRAIVTDTPGTTRDTIEEYLNINGLPLRIIDTAGIRESHDMAEKEGVKRSLNAIAGADLVIAVLDGSESFSREDKEVIKKVKGKHAIIAVNKADRMSQQKQHDFNNGLTQYELEIVKVSALTGDGLSDLKQAIFDSCLRNWQEQKEGVIITNLRHKIAIQSAHDSLTGALHAIETDKPIEIIALELRDALNSLGEIIGAVTTEDILNRIFSSFCIGK